MWPLLAAVTLAALVAGLGPSLQKAAGDPGARNAGALRAQGASLAQRENAALLDLYAAESTLARARADAASVSARRQAVATERQSVVRRAAVVRRSVAIAQARLGSVLRSLYLHGQPDPIAIVLGAVSLDEAVNELDAYTRSARLNRHLIAQMRSTELSLRDAEARLAQSDRSLAAAQAEADATAGRLAEAVLEKTRLVSSLRSQRALTRARLAQLEQAARAAQERSAKISAQSVTAAEPATPTPASTAPATTTPPATTTGSAAPISGTHTLVVDAVAYHLPGRTASGLPVGPGVVAVDPTVIPLGTRMFVPGYGPAVAADVGSAVRGNIIDLWMPTTAKALAWGRRTVTITIYG
jgi:3D (Asp-Asp-Asp) domain-containing protein